MNPSDFIYYISCTVDSIYGKNQYPSHAIKTKCTPFPNHISPSRCPGLYRLHFPPVDQSGRYNETGQNQIPGQCSPTHIHCTQSLNGSSMSSAGLWSSRTPAIPWNKLETLSPSSVLGKYHHFVSWYCPFGPFSTIEQDLTTDHWELCSDFPTNREGWIEDEKALEWCTQKWPVML